MKTYVKLVASALICLLVAACDNGAGDFLWPEGADVPFTTYSFEATPDGTVSARWVNLDRSGFDDYSDGKVLVIDSDQELKKYVEGDYPPVDFTTKTLILAYGGYEYASVPDSSDRQYFRHISGRNYILTINIPPFAGTALSVWEAAVVVDKLPKGSTIEFKLTLNYWEM